MSQSWNEGYFTDIGYTHGYYRDINPVFQQFCLLLRGFAGSMPAAPATRQHCELGYGQGLSINIHAAANPGHFVGTDFNPAQAANAQQLAQASGSGALLLDDSFEQLLARTDLPQFDSISLHGIWTWVSVANQRAIVELARQRLKPGGLLYLSYNCFPGWAPAAPLRQLFALHDQWGQHPPAASERVDTALKFAENLLAAQPKYLALVPHLTERLSKLATQNRNYLAHEYFNREWNCMYFTDVVQALAPAKLDWACSAHPIDAVDVVNLTPQAQEFLQAQAHPLLREQVRDYFVNQQFRKDLFMRGVLRLSVAEQRERLLDTRLVLAVAPGQVPMTVLGALGQATLQEEVYRPYINALAADGGSPKTLRQLLTALGTAASPNWQQLLQVLAVLTHMGTVLPCHPEEIDRQVRSRCKALNRHLCQQARYGDQTAFLASPVTGGGIGVGRIGQLLLLGREQGHKQPAEWAKFAWQIFQSQGQRLIKNGAELQTPEENLAELTEQATGFAANTLPILKAMQVVQ